MKDMPYKRGSLDDIMETTDPVRGYKGFYKVGNNKFVCRDTIYECPGLMYISGEPALCEHGIHFCQDLRDVLEYYSPNKGELHVAEVVAIGKTLIGYDKCVTNRIVLVEEVDLCEALKDYNFGVKNIGKYNIGNNNRGDKNLGDNNNGSLNIGDNNTGGMNFGSNNNGIRNVGDSNLGNNNIGDVNAGANNIGTNNRGAYNIGCFNVGFDCGKGCFNTESIKMRMFNKPCEFELEDWYRSDAYRILRGMPGSRDPHPIGARLIVERQEWWDKLGSVDKQSILNIPNFDPLIFYQITGISVGSFTKPEIKVIPDLGDKGEYNESSNGY